MNQKETKLTQVSIEINNEDVDRLTNKLTDFMSGKRVTTANVLSIVTQLMVAVAKYQNLTGGQKKELVIYVMRVFIKSSDDIDADDKREILAMFDVIVPSAIDLLVVASKSKFAFKLKKKLLRCCS
jgi:hypothetical protein